MDIINKINEAVSYKVLRSIKWENLMMDFFGTYDNLMYMAKNNKKNTKAQNAYTTAENMMKNLQSFLDNWPGLEKAAEDARTKQDEMMKKMNKPM